MTISLQKIYKILFLVGIFFIPFNSYEGIAFLGEFKKEAAIVFFFLSFFFFFLEVAVSRKMKFPTKNIFFQFLIIFTIWIFISGIFNISNILNNHMKQTYGIIRFLRQLVSYSIVILFFLVSYNIISKYSLKFIFFKIRKIFFFSFSFVCFYSLFEILILNFNIFYLKNIFKIFDYFPFLESSLDTTHGRVSSVSHEPPFLAIYLITIAGWMFSYILTSKKTAKFLPTLFIFIITFYSGSRTALIVILIQFFTFIFISLTINKRFYKLIKNMFVFLLAGLFLIYIFNSSKVTEEVSKKISTLNFKKNLSKNISNKSRLGIQYTSLLVFKKNPIFGVGYGQQGYSSRELYPSWATNKNWEFKYFYLNDNIKSFPPGYNLYTRLLAETGIIGFLILIMFIYLILKQTLKNKKYAKKKYKILPVILYVSFVGFFINWLQFDSFRVFGFWICLSLLILQTKYIKFNE